MNHTPENTGTTNSEPKPEKPKPATKQPVEKQEEDFMPKSVKRVLMNKTVHVHHTTAGAFIISRFLETYRPSKLFSPWSHFCVDNANTLPDVLSGHFIVTFLQTERKPIQ